MLRFLSVRLWNGLLVMVGVSFVSFLLFNYIGDPVNNLVGETATIERARVVADRVMRELFNWPIVLPGELVYFARTAALIEGVGARYDRHFNSIKVASPVVLKMRRELLAVLLGDDGTREPIITLAATLGALAGGATAVIRRTWRRLQR